MIIYSKITEIFCIVDEFCKEFDQLVDKHLLGNPSKRPSTMSKSEVITITILFQLSGFRTFKHFYIYYLQKHMRNDFPNTVSYNRFTELMQQSLMPMTLFLKTCCLGDCTGISFVDSTPIRVCKPKRIKNNKVFKGIATTGKSTMGWFHGFKLHIVINDKGYIGKDLMQILFTDGLHLITHIKNNMKNSLMTMSDKILLRKRSVIETVNDELKNICQIEHSRHRSFTNFLSNIVAGLIAYSFLPKKPSIKYQTVHFFFHLSTIILKVFLSAFKSFHQKPNVFLDLSRIS